MKQLICIAFLLLQVSISVNANGYYTIVAPGTIQSNSEYTVTVTVHDSPGPAAIKVGISGPSYNISKTLEVQPYSAEILLFDVPPLEHGEYELQTEGLGGLIFKRYSKLNYKNELPQVYVQTDKALYKPGDLVQYRILALDASAKPANTTEPITLVTRDGASNKIKKIKDLQFTKGVHSGKFQLSKQPVLGDWTIEVIVGGNGNKAIATKEFEVAKYVLPKFSVNIETDKQVGILDKVVKITVRSKYTHSQPVIGNATITASFKSYTGQTVPVAQKTVDIDGKAELEFNLMDDLDMGQRTNLFMSEIDVLAIVTEAFTGLQQNTSATVQVEQSRFTITVSNMSREYEVDKPFEIKAIIRKLNGSPVTNAKSTAKLTLGYDYMSAERGSGLIFESEVDEKGLATFKLKFKSPRNYPSVKIMYEEKTHTLNGLNVLYPPNKYQEIHGIHHGVYGPSGYPYGPNGVPGFGQQGPVGYRPYVQPGASVYPGTYGQPGIPAYPGIYLPRSISASGPQGTIGYSGQPGTSAYPGVIQPAERVGPLAISINATEPKIGEEIYVAVKSDDPIPYFVYTIMARGKILKHEYVKVGGDKKSHVLKIKVTFDMAPNAKLFFYFVYDGELRHDELTISVPQKFQNKLEITAQEQAQPGDLVTLNIKTDPDSFVGLLAVDQSVLLLQAGNDLDEQQMFHDLFKYDSITPWSDIRYTYPGRNLGFLTLTNACYQRQYFPGYQYGASSQGYSAGVPGAGMGIPQGASMGIPSFGQGPHMAMAQPGYENQVNVVQPAIRKHFVENWIFDNIESTDVNGITNFTKKIPDTITSWVITGFSMNENTGFGITQAPTKIRGFQPFFVSLNLPYSVKRGEVIAIPIVVFNYMEMALDAEITLDNTEDEFSFTEAFTDVEDNILNDKQRTKRVTVPSDGGATVSFMIYPRQVGEITLKIKAITAVAGDAIHQKLTVEPEGLTEYKNEAFFVSIPSGGKPVKHTFKADIPADVVVNSEFLEFAAVSDILGPTIENIDRLVRMPYGCGEQNMINFVPNILVLRYMDAIKMDNPAIVEKAKNYMEIGYQRQLTYKHGDGAYSTFGVGHSQANTWLTAYVARSFIQARKYITIDENVIEQALGYLATTQRQDGQFVQTGSRLYNTDHNDVGISAFVLLAFMEDMDYALRYKTQIDRALQYLDNNVEREDDVYTLALISLVFQKAKHPQAGKLLERLQLKSNYENNLKWWSTSAKYQKNNIEITAYILQSLLVTEADDSKLLPIVKWLVRQRNSLGGFESTQDTVVGLQALIKFAEKYAAGGRGKIDIKFEVQDEAGHETASGSFSVDKEDGLDLISYEFSRATRQLTVTAEGEGTALIQFSYRYNLATQDDNEPSFLIKHTHKQLLSPGHISMYVCAEYKPQLDSGVIESNMAVMEIFLPSGFKTDEDSLEPIRDARQVQRVETKNADTIIVVYFESLVVLEPACFDVYAEKYHGVAKLKPAAITVYDYYNTKQRATVFYEVKSSLCDICEKEECGKGCRTR